MDYTIVGVMGAAFRADDLGVAPAVWLPLRLDPESRTEGHFFAVGGRLRPGVTLEQAQAQMRLSTEEFRREFPNALSGNSAFSVQPVREALVGNTRPLFVVLLGAVAFVLLIACSNLATLLLLQGESRRREMAVRAAIGAGRGRMVRQLLTEHMLLALCGGAVGLALGWFAMHLLLGIGIAGLSRLNEITAVSLDWRVIAFTVAVSIATGVLFGLVPALRVSRTDLSAVTKSADERSSRGPERRRTEAVLVLQVSLALVLLIGSALFMRTVVALTRVDAGFDPDHVLTMRTSLSGPDFASAPQVEAVVRRGMDALGAVPGVAQLPDVANAFVAARAPMAWIVRTTMSPEALARTLQQTLQQATGLPVSNVRSMNEIVMRSISRQRLSMWLMAAFGAAALLLAMIGLYGLVAHSVEQRTREIGIRLALGAEASRVKGMVISQGMSLMVAGTVVGLLTALAFTRLITRWLFSVQPWDPATFILVPVLVLIMASLAVWLPARRASRVDPIVALRYE